MIFRTTQLLLTFAAALLIPIGVHANDIEPGSENYDANETSISIVIDGDLSEWSGANSTVNPRFSIPKGSASDPNVDGTLVVHEENGGTWDGPDDQSTDLQILWDADNVYLGLVVTDDYHENAMNSAWNGDSAQMMISNGARDAQVALYNFALGGIEGALGDIIVNEEAGPGGIEGVVTRNGDTKLTTYEIKFPKESLALAELTAGVQFGLGMAVNDGDEATPGQKGWGGLGAHAIVFGKTPAETALVTLQVPEPSSIGLCMMAIGTLLLRRRKGQR